MSEFQVGDKVRRINTDATAFDNKGSTLKINNIYEVSFIATGQAGLCLKEQPCNCNTKSSNYGLCWERTNFELVNRFYPHLKVGDTVKVIDPTNVHGWDGVIGKVIEIDSKNVDIDRSITGKPSIIDVGSFGIENKHIYTLEKIEKGHNTLYPNFHLGDTVKVISPNKHWDGELGKITTLLPEYLGITKTIINSNGQSIEETFTISNKEIYVLEKIERKPNNLYPDFRLEDKVRVISPTVLSWHNQVGTIYEVRKDFVGITVTSKGDMLGTNGAFSPDMDKFKLERVVIAFETPVVKAELPATCFNFEVGDSVLVTLTAWHGDAGWKMWNNAYGYVFFCSPDKKLITIRNSFTRYTSTFDFTLHAGIVNFNKTGTIPVNSSKAKANIGDQIEVPVTISYVNNGISTISSVEENNMVGIKNYCGELKYFNLLDVKLIKKPETTTVSGGYFGTGGSGNGGLVITVDPKYTTGYTASSSGMGTLTWGGTNIKIDNFLTALPKYDFEITTGTIEEPSKVLTTKVNIAQFPDTDGLKEAAKRVKEMPKFDSQPEDLALITKLTEQPSNFSFKVDCSAAETGRISAGIPLEVGYWRHSSHKAKLAAKPKNKLTKFAWVTITTTVLSVAGGLVHWLHLI